MNADAKTLDRDRSLRGVPDGMLIDGEWVSAASGPNVRSAESRDGPGHREGSGRR